MAKGYYLVLGDKTTCGGKILSGDPRHTLMGKPVVREQEPVTCGLNPGMFAVVGAIPSDLVNGRKFAGTTYSKSSCPCQARLIPSITIKTYETRTGEAQNKTTADQAKQPVLSSYVTGEKTDSGYVPDYPATALINTHNFPDMRLRALLQSNNQDIALLTPEECIEVLTSWGTYKNGWITITQSATGTFIINYGTNVKDVVTTSMIISQLGSFGIKATNFTNTKGTELIKISGYPGVRKILNAPVFAVKNPKIVDLGIGRLGVTKSIIEGARITFYVAAAYRILDYILNDETTLSTFIGSLATDIAKIGIVSAITWGTQLAAATLTTFVAGPLIAAVVVGFITAAVLNELDNKFGITDKLVKHLESAQQEFVWQARQLEEGIWDIGAMYADQMLNKGVEVIKSEMMRYLRSSLKELAPQNY
ncbi:PAAR domain-containing protein (plasmid) [Rahnella variigena]|uniref:PAAR domain-containing protein n=2 Tax=Rahnella TaxID=34037 RepID=UPI0024469504|nr:PAAR domain-containing protein [Rahnella variigena]MDH2896011.1 PAAR domain-containing protein [Rahnella variigena]